MLFCATITFALRTALRSVVRREPRVQVLALRAIRLPWYLRTVTAAYSGNMVSCGEQCCCVSWHDGVGVVMLACRTCSGMQTAKGVGKIIVGLI